MHMHCFTLYHYYTKNHAILIARNWNFRTTVSRELVIFNHIGVRGGGGQEGAAAPQFNQKY